MCDAGVSRLCPDDLMLLRSAAAAAAAAHKAAEQAQAAQRTAVARGSDAATEGVS